MSALPLEGGGDWLEAAGFAGYLEKPISVGAFPDQVRRYCTSRGRRGASRRVARARASTPSNRQRARLARARAPSTLRLALDGSRVGM